MSNRTTTIFMSVSAPNKPIRAVEFYSGIGGFAEAARNRGIEIIAAFDQYDLANEVYQYNFGLKPVARTLDHIRSIDIPEAEIWWLSPPCTPFTIRGKRLDANDPRSISFVNLINLIPQCVPEIVLVENVSGFVKSKVHHYLATTLLQNGYSVSEYGLCPTQFGIPMKRPRCFIVASRKHVTTFTPPSSFAFRQPLSGFLDDSLDPDLILDSQIQDKHSKALNIVDPLNGETTLICVTSGYGKCLKASGSYLLLGDGRVRRLSPNEILRLLGFSKDYSFPAYIALPTRWRLVGNSVDTRSISFLLGCLT